MTETFSRRPRRLAACALLILSLCTPGIAQTPGGQTPSATVTVTVEAVRSDGGRVTGSLCVDPKTPFCSTYVARTKAVAGRNELRFEGVAPGRYSLSTVHDEDGDGRTEIPPEGFGLGNNAPAPSFEASSIQVAGNMSTKVTMTYPGGARRAGSRGVEPPEGTVRIDVRDGGLYGELYAPKNAASRLPTVILIDGSTPGLDGVSFVASEFARAGFAALALAYFGEQGLPPTLEGVPLEYFDAAFAALKARPDIDADRIGVFGFSRGSEAAFMLAIRNPNVRAVAAAGPSHVLWLGYDAADPASGEAAWTIGGKAPPFVSPDLSSYDPNASRTANFARALAEADAKPAAAIPVERIKGPILMISGEEDEIWPSSDMARRIEARLSKAGFSHSVENIVISGAGHSVLAAGPGAMTRFLNFFRKELGN